MEKQLRVIDFIPLIGLFTYQNRIGRAGVKTFLNNIKNDTNYFYCSYNKSEFDQEIDNCLSYLKKDMQLFLYHITCIAGITCSPLIYKGLENLMK